MKDITIVKIFRTILLVPKNAVLGCSGIVFQKQFDAPGTGKQIGGMSHPGSLHDYSAFGQEDEFPYEQEHSGSRFREMLVKEGVIVSLPRDSCTILQETAHLQRGQKL
jgi:hypothetical protein